MHLQTLSWSKLSQAERDSKLVVCGLTLEELNELRLKEPRERILQAAKLALRIDEEPNSDLVEYIAGYRARAGVYHFFRSMDELMDSVGMVRGRKELNRITHARENMDLTSVIPERIAGYVVHVETARDPKCVIVWQKVNGGMRKVSLTREIPRESFIVGLLLYSTEGTKSEGSTRAEIANSTPSIHRLFLRFLQNLGVERSQLSARVQVHDVNDFEEARGYWVGELGLNASQFRKPLLSATKGFPRRRTFTLQLSFSNTMLLMLLRYWTANLESYFS